jgi:quinol-cytochrome oxidoreductase complex cytochrome b subunit
VFIFTLIFLFILKKKQIHPDGRTFFIFYFLFCFFIFVNLREGEKNPTKKIQKKKKKKQIRPDGWRFLNFYFLFCFFIFVNLKEGETNPTKKIQKKKKKANTSGRTDGHTERLQNRPRKLTGQNVKT